MRASRSPRQLGAASHAEERYPWHFVNVAAFEKLLLCRALSRVRGRPGSAGRWQLLRLETLMKKKDKEIATPPRRV